MSSNTLEIFFKLLRLGLNVEKADENMLIGFRCLNINKPYDINWEGIYSFGVLQGVAAIQFDGLQKFVESANDIPFQLPEKRLKMKWFSHSMQVEKHCQSQFNMAAELADVYAKNEIRTIILKGIAAGRNYPNPDHRPCGDLDCFLLGKYELGNAVAEKAGATVITNHYKHSQISYKGLTVENHRFCAPIRGDERLKQFESLLQLLIYEEGTTKLNGTMLEVPSPMFDALFLTHHAQRHFLTEGIALRHLCDWAMLLYQQGDKVDWGEFNNYCEKYGMRQFADTMTRVSAKYLGIAIPEKYVLERNDYRDTTLIDCMMHYNQHRGNGNVWYSRMKLLMSVYENRKRYKLFSDKSMISDLWKLVYGFCFDRSPHL